MTAEKIHTCSYSCERPGCIRAQRDELVARLEALTSAPQPVSAGEEIIVSTPNDVMFILPLQPSGRSIGPRFVVHVPLVEAPAVKALQAEIERLREALKEIRSRSCMNLAMNPNPVALTALLGDIHQIAGAALAKENGQ